MNRHEVRHSTRVGLVVSLAALGLILGGCGTPPVSGHLRPSQDRSQRLTAMAADEAKLIPDADTRLTRQLNLAYLQIARGWEADARGTLAAAVETLNSNEAAKLNDHARLSGWVSISELSRRIKDDVIARNACDQAVKAVRQIEDPARRCEYVMGIANELQYLQGKPAAINLLAEAGPWTRSIDNLSRRRQAEVAFASALFNLDDYDAGQKMLRQDEDPAWRSQTLLSMAMPRPAALAKASRDIASPAAVERDAAIMRQREESETPGQLYYGRKLDFGSIFQGQTNSQTGKE